MFAEFAWMMQLRVQERLGVWMPYIVLSGLVTEGFFHGLHIAIGGLWHRRPSPHAVCGLALAVWCSVLCFAGIVSAAAVAAPFVGLAAIDAAAEHASQAPSVVRGLAALPSWSLVCLVLAGRLTLPGFKIILGRPQFVRGEH